MPQKDGKKERFHPQRVLKGNKPLKHRQMLGWAEEEIKRAKINFTFENFEGQN